MKLVQQFLTKNSCYVAGKKITVKGIMVHSTGANNPNVSRYVPGNAEIGVNKYSNHWNRSGLDKCVHAFIGKFADGKVGIVQTLPWNYRGWHGGKGKNGSANDSYIGFEICEDNLTDSNYFNQVYNAAVELTAYLCSEYKLNPLGKNVIICHNDGYKLGISSSHVDITHWFPKHGKSMETFRQDVNKKMGNYVVPEEKPNNNNQGYYIYVVKSGDSWWKIAANELGSGSRYTELQKFNPDIGSSIHPGDKIKIPCENTQVEEEKPVEPTTKPNSDVSAYAQEAWEKATKKGIVDGTNPKGVVTREMYTVILNALGQLD